MQCQDSHHDWPYSSRTSCALVKTTATPVLTHSSAHGWQDRDASLKRLRALAKSTAEKASKEKASAAAQPLEASQRAVIRDLSLRVANLTRVNNQLKEERERAQVWRVSLPSLPALLISETYHTDLPSMITLE